jgi:hypothetical protein
MNGSHQKADSDLCWNGNLSIPAGVRDSGPRSDRPRRRVAGRLSPSACAKFRSIVPACGVPHAPSVRELRRAMADAHPDRGGTTEQFIDARRRYQTALRPARR